MRVWNMQTASFRLQYLHPTAFKQAKHKQGPANTKEIISHLTTAKRQQILH